MVGSSWWEGSMDTASVVRTRPLSIVTANAQDRKAVCRVCLAVCSLEEKKEMDVPVLMVLAREGIVVSGRRCMKERRDFFLEYVTVVELILVVG